MATRISVVVPCYNAEPFLRQAIESLWETQYPNLEVIYFDDGSTDGSLDLAYQLAGEHEGMHVFTHRDRANHGAGVTRNAAVQEATGEYLAFLDADDYVFSNRFSGPARLLDDNPDIDAVCGTTERILSQGGEDRVERIRSQTVFECDDPDRVLEYRLFGKLAWSTNAILMRRTAFDRAGGFSERRTAEDAALWLKLACVARIASAGSEPMAVYRIHASNSSSTLFYRPRFTPLNSYVVSEALVWARSQGVQVDRLGLLFRAVIGRTLLDNRRLREDLQFFGALRHLGCQLVHHPALLKEDAIWRGIGCTLLESLRLRRPAFTKTDTGN